MRCSLGVFFVAVLGCGDSQGDETGGGTTMAATGSSTGDEADTVTPPDDDGVDPATSSSDGSPDDTTGTPVDTTGGADEPGPLVVYVTDGEAAIHLFAVDARTGALDAIATYDTGPGASQLALHPDGLHLYATARAGNDRVISYAIDPVSGALTELGVTPLTIGPVYVAIDPSGGWAMFADFGGDDISVHAIGADFVVQEGPAQERSVGDEPHAIVPSPDGAHVYVPHRGTNEIRQFALDATTGMLTELDPSSVAAAPGAGARHLAFEPNGIHAYLSDEFSDSVTHFVRDPATGLLTRMATEPTLFDGFDGNMNTTADVHVTPDGAHVYVSNRGHDSLAMFAADPASGALTGIGTVPTEATPRELEVDPTGRFVYSAGQSSGNVVGYAIDRATGTLDPIGETWTVGGSPLWVLAVELPAR